MIATIVAAPVSYGDLVDQMVMQWEGHPYAELSVVVSWLRALAQIHQSHHWQSSADPFYGDHLMYDRIYTAVNEDVDKVAEKALGLGTIDLVDPMKLIRQSEFVLASVYLVRPGIPQSFDLATRSLNAEKAFLDALERVGQLLAARRMLTKGLDNMLAQIADDHEGHMYLLKQRCGATV